jgi:hypothetical protein
MLPSAGTILIDPIYAPVADIGAESVVHAVFTGIFGIIPALDMQEADVLNAALFGVQMELMALDSVKTGPEFFGSIFGFLGIICLAVEDIVSDLAVLVDLKRYKVNHVIPSLSPVWCRL